jgi:hypothetical protein
MRSSPEGNSSSPWRAVGVGTGAVAIGFSGFVLLDARAGRKRWPAPTQQLVGVPPNVRKVTLAFPGLGSDGGRDQARHIQSVIPGPSAYCVYPEKPSPRELAKELCEQAPDLEEVNIAGHSMGGLLGLETARYARRSRLSDLKLGCVVLFDTPEVLAHGRGGKASRALSVVKWPTGPAHKYLFQLGRGLIEGEPLIQAHQAAKKDASSGCSSKQWLNMWSILESTKIARHTDEYTEMVGPNTSVVYCRSQLDTTVRNIPASEKFGEFCADIGAPYQILDIAGAMHGDVAMACARLALMESAAA